MYYQLYLIKRVASVNLHIGNQQKEVALHSVELCIGCSCIGEIKEIKMVMEVSGLTKPKNPLAIRYQLPDNILTYQDASMWHLIKYDVKKDSTFYGSDLGQPDEYESRPLPNYMFRCSEYLAGKKINPNNTLLYFEAEIE
jgi:hypothetical protein